RLTEATSNLAESYVSYTTPRDTIRFVASSGLRRITFHSLRHTHASLLFAAGVHPKIVQERLGHSSIAVTLDVYAHTIPTMQAGAAAALEHALGVTSLTHTPDGTRVKKGKIRQRP
ncbi:MAG: hypothetical protein DLM50_01820, partial [Candidatus Meridianibacter frigidus]